MCDPTSAHRFFLPMHLDVLEKKLDKKNEEEVAGWVEEEGGRRYTEYESCLLTDQVDV